MVGPAPGVRFAGHGARLGAYILDAILLGFFVTAFVLVLPSSSARSDWSVDNGDLMLGDEAAACGSPPLRGRLDAHLVLVMLYFPFFWARGGETPGMKVAGIRVVNDRDGSRIGWGSAILRLIGWWVSAAVFYLGFVWILIDSRRRGWHDLIAGTCVISREVTVSAAGPAASAWSPSRSARTSRDALGDHNGAAWPEFMLQDPVANRLWHHLDEELAAWQYLLLDADDRIAAAGNSAPLSWDGTDDGLPAGLGRPVRAHGRRSARRDRPNTLGAIQVVVAPERQGERLAGPDGRDLPRARAGRPGSAR